MPWLLYALGGGWGHLQRSLALGRLLARETPVSLLTNSPYAARVHEPGVELVRLAPDLPADRVRQQVHEWLQARSITGLVVDTFPRGLGGELVESLAALAERPRVLVHRDLNPAYVQAREVRTFVATRYDRIIIPGEGSAPPGLPLADLPQVCHTAPWLIRSSHELPSPDQIRAALQVPIGLPLVLVLAAGQLAEQAWFGAVTRAISTTLPQVAVRCLAFHCPPGCPPQLWHWHWPAIEYLGAATVVVGGAGYNTLQECQALGVPLVARPWRRLYDRQPARIARHPRTCVPVVQVEDAVQAVQHLVRTDRPRSQNYANGAVQAAALLCHLGRSLPPITLDR